MGSKGQTFGDLTLFIILLVVVGVASVFGWMIYSDLNDEIQADGDMSAEAQAASQNVADNYPSMFDNVFLFILILFWIFLLVSSFLIDTHPIFFVVTVILLLFVFVVGMILANAYEEVTSDPDLIGFADDFPITSWVMTNFLLVIIVIGLSAGLALYAKNKL